MSAQPAATPEPAADPLAESARRLAEDDIEAALAALQQAAAGDAGSPRFNLVMSLVAWRLAEIDRAVKIALDCHRRAPMNGTIAEVLASLFAQVGNLNDSLYYGKLAIALGPAEGFAELLPPAFPTFDKAFLAIEDRPLLARGRFLLASGNLRDGLDLLRQHVALMPDDDEARIALGEVLLHAGQAAAAAQSLEPRAREAGAPAVLASLCARALAMAGEPERSRRFHEQACMAAADDPTIAAARIADAFWNESAPVLTERIADWSRRFLPPARPARWQRPEGKLIVGYLVSRLADPRDAAAIAAVAAAHDRGRTTVVAFGNGAQSWAENAALSGAFDRWRDIAGVDPATLSRILRGEGLNAVVDCAGFAAPAQIDALGRLRSAIRVAWLGIPHGIGAPFFDAVLGNESGSPPSWGARYPLASAWMRPMPRIPAVALRFGTDACMPQIDASTVTLWSAILREVPGTVLLLRGNDMGPGPNIDRLVDRFGRELAARIDVVNAATAEEFYRRVDVALTPLRGTSPRMAAEALACGVPVVAAGTPYGAFLREHGLGATAGSDEQEYLSIAIGLAVSVDARQHMTSAIVDASSCQGSEPRQVAAVLEARVAAALAEAAQ
jgi:tetratricopeptide (TPR) repeat protein